MGTQLVDINKNEWHWGANLLLAGLDLEPLDLNEREGFDCNNYMFWTVGSTASETRRAVDLSIHSLKEFLLGVSR